MKTALLFTWLLLTVAASAQDSLTTKRPAYLYGLATYDFPKSYGFILGTSVPFRSFTKEKLNRDYKHLYSVKDEFVSAEVGAYWHPLGYSGIIVNAGIGIRYIRSTKHFTELSFNQGILRTVYDGKVYELNPNGNIKERILFGRTYATTGFSYSLNWSFKKANSDLWLIQLKPVIWVQYPYNSFLKLHCSLQAGICYHLKNITLPIRTKHL